METLVLLSIIPLLAAMVSAIQMPAKVTRVFIPFLIWLQLAVVVIFCNKAIFNQHYVKILSPDFSYDHISILFILLTTVVTACSLTHAKLYFENEEVKEDGAKPEQEQVFYVASCLFFLSMLAVFLCDNLGFLWISIELTTLCSAVLVAFAASKHALEATWKYLIICSVGIAFALFGTILIFASSQHGAIVHGSLNIRELIAAAPRLEFPLLRLGFIFCLVGYGTKAGIFPLHSWLPDAHSEAPAPASAMLSGALLNCALFAIWRISELVSLSHHDALAHDLPLVAGTITALAASLFLVQQHGLKRLWAYSSIENVGIMLVAIGFGSSSLFFLQALNHSLAKVSLFLLSGNVVQFTGSKELSEIRGLMSSKPVWGILLFCCAFAVTGAPPFGAFISEWLLLAYAADHKYLPVFIGLVVALAISSIAVAFHLARILFGSPKANDGKLHALNGISSSFIPIVLTACAIIAGISSLPYYLVDLK